MLKINNLTKIFKGGVIAVNDLSLHVLKGDIFGFIGHNGAGKTTTIKCITGIHEFDKGEIFINDISLKDNPLECKRQFAYIPDNPNIYPYLTGIQYLNLIADIFKISKEDRIELIKKEADDFEITQSLGDLISSYSQGMRQKLSIIGALIHKPKLLILDEPFIGLDPKAVLILKNKMKELCNDGGSVFFSTHVLDVAERLCNKIAIIKNGRLVVCGKTQDLTSNESLENVFMEALNND